MLIFTVYLHISKFVVKYFAYIVICTVFVVYIRERLVAMPSEVKADLDGEFLTAIAEQPNEILKCAMYLFLGYLDGATQFAQSRGGGGGDSSLPWGRKDDEDDRSFAYRCMMQPHKMLKSATPKRGMGR